MNRDSFVFYRSFIDSIEDAPADEFKNAVLALTRYALDGEEVTEDFVSKMYLTLVKPQIDANNARYENGKKGAEHGKRGGRPKKETPSEDQENPKETADTENENPKETPKQETETPNVNVNVNENVNVNAKEEKKKEEKHKHGDGGHVLLTDKEYQKLHGEYSNADELIQFLDDAKEMKGYTYKSDYMAIKKWVVTAVEEQKQRVQKLKPPALHDAITADDLPF